MRIVVAGSGRLGTAVIEPLLESRHTVVALLQNGRKIRGLRRPLALLNARYLGTTDRALDAALREDIPILWLDRMNGEDLDPIRALELDLIIACGFGIIFNAQLLELPRLGCINVHSSLLPKHRGAAPFTHAVLADEAETGVTFHVMNEGIDSGDILDQKAFPLYRFDTALSVYLKACEVTRNRVLEVVDRIESEGLCGAPQQPDAASYDKKLGAEDLRIHWERSAEDIDRLIRAGLSFSEARFAYRGRLVHVTQADYESDPVEALPGTLLEVKPHLKVATGHGVVTVLKAYTRRPAVASWPGFWDRRPSSGERLE